MQGDESGLLLDRLRIEMHKSQFRCSICGTPSNGPALIGVPLIPELGYFWETGGEKVALEELDWDTPTGLKSCAKCGSYYCERHKNHRLQGGCTRCSVENLV